MRVWGMSYSFHCSPLGTPDSLLPVHVMVWDEKHVPQVREVEYQKLEDMNS